MARAARPPAAGLERDKRRLARAARGGADHRLLADVPLVSGARAEPTAVIARDALAVLEVKVAGAMPRWLEREVTDLGRYRAYRHSKFRAGMDALRPAEPTSTRNIREFARADSPPVGG